MQGGREGQPRSRPLPLAPCAAIVSSGAQESMSPLVVENATKQFRQGDRVVDALAGVSLEVKRGQFVAIMGASGSGKSTLLHLMAGLAKPQSGKVIVNGSDISSMGDRELTL